MLLGDSVPLLEHRSLFVAFARAVEAYRLDLLRLDEGVNEEGVDDGGISSEMTRARENPHN